MFASQSQDGVVVGATDPAIGPIHLTILKKDGRFTSHITDATQTPPRRIRAVDVNVEAQRFLRRAMRLYVRRYRRTEVAWMMTPQLRERIRKTIQPVRKGRNLVYPLENQGRRFPLDFRDPEGWVKVKIIDILKWPPGEWGWKVSEGKAYLVRPIDEKVAMWMTERQARNYFLGALEVLGFKSYGDYIRSAVSIRRSVSGTGRPSQ